MCDWRLCLGIFTLDTDIEESLALLGGESQTEYIDLGLEGKVDDCSGW